MKNLFATICHLEDKSKEIEAISEDKYKEIILRIKPKDIEEIREWSRE